MLDFILDDTYDVAPDQRAGLCGTLPRIAPVGSLKFCAPPSFPLIPVSEWQVRAEEMEREQTRLSDFIRSKGIRSYNQQQTNYCHGNSAAMAVEIIRAVEGQPYARLSPASVAGPITGFRNEGAYIADDLQQIVNGGVASQDFVPANQIGKSGFKSGWEADAATRKVIEWWDLGHKGPQMAARCATLLLSRIPICVAYNWWGHAVTLIDLVFKNGEFYFRFLNSWGTNWPDDGAEGYALLPVNGKGNPDEAYAPTSTRLAA